MCVLSNRSMRVRLPRTMQAQVNIGYEPHSLSRFQIGHFKDLDWKGLLDKYQGCGWESLLPNVDKV